MRAPSAQSASGTPTMRSPTLIGMAVRARLRVADRRLHIGLEARRHRVLHPLGLLVHVVPRHADDVGQEALDQAVAARDLLGVAATVVGERDHVVLAARDVAVSLEAADHLVHGRRRELHRAREVGAGHRQARLVEPEEHLQVLLLGDRGVLVRHAADRSRFPLAATIADRGAPALSSAPSAARALARRTCPRGRAGRTSRSGTASARSRSWTATSWRCSRAAADRSGATSPS